MKKYCICCRELLNDDVECHIHLREHGMKNSKNISISLGIPESLSEIKESQKLVDKNYNIGEVFNVNKMNNTILISMGLPVNIVSVTFDEFVNRFYIINLPENK